MRSGWFTQLECLSVGGSDNFFTLVYFLFLWFIQFQEQFFANEKVSAWTNRYSINQLILIYSGNE